MYIQKGNKAEGCPGNHKSRHRVQDLGCELEELRRQKQVDSRFGGSLGHRTESHEPGKFLVTLVCALE